MPHYFFHLYDDKAVLDEEGTSLEDDAQARNAALDGARELACAEVHDGCLNLTHRIEAVNELGEVVATVNFAEASGLG